MTDEECLEKIKEMPLPHRKFILNYLQNGLDSTGALIQAGLSEKSLFGIFRKYNPVIEHLIQRFDLSSHYVRPSWIIHEYMKLYNSTPELPFKVNILNQLSRIMKMQNDKEVSIVNEFKNINNGPVQIVFSDEEE